MKTQTHNRQLKLSFAALFCTALLYGCSNNGSPIEPTSTATQNKTPADQVTPAVVEAKQESVQKVAEIGPTQDELLPQAMLPMGASHLRSQLVQNKLGNYSARSVIHLPLPQPITVNQDRYASIDSNPVKQVSEQPVSTFSLDVDTGSYAVVRRHIQHGQLPPADAVRVEELINYSTPAVKDKQRPFAFTTELATAPWHEQRQLLRVSLAAWQQPMDKLPPSNLVF